MGCLQALWEDGAGRGDSRGENGSEQQDGYMANFSILAPGMGDAGCERQE